MVRVCYRWDCSWLLTAWCRVLLEQLTGLQLVKKFPAFHGTRKFITALTNVRHLSLSWASPIQSIYPHPNSWRSVLILSTHLRLGLPIGSFPPVSPSRPLYTPPLLTHTRHMPSPSHSSRFYYPHNKHLSVSNLMGIWTWLGLSKLGDLTLFRGVNQEWAVTVLVTLAH